MAPAQTKLALRLYARYQCDTREYRELAAEIGIDTGELNRRCWKIRHDREAAKRNAKANP